MRGTSSRLCFGYLTLLGVGWTAEPAEAPLADSKKALRELHRDQAAAGAPASGASLRDYLPPIAEPGAGTLPSVTPPTPQKRDEALKKKQAEQKNWLLNGVTKLERNSSIRDGSIRSGTTEATTENDEANADSTEPPTLLGLYAERKKAEEGKTALKPDSAPAKDPLAPFLQRWLAESPGRGTGADATFNSRDATRGTDGSAPAMGPASSDPAVVLGDLPGAEQGGMAGGGERSRTSNPYLQSLTTLSEPAMRRESMLEPTLSPSRSQPQTEENRILSPLPPVEKKAAPVPPADDKKYFPQQKKF